MLEAHAGYQYIQIIQWQLTTRLVGVQQTQDIFMMEDCWPALIPRDHGFNNYEDSEAVYLLLEEAQQQHPELKDCDAISRLLSLYDVMSAAALHADKSDEILKVFIAPDGYFTNSSDGIYSLVQTRLIKHLLQSVIGSQPRFYNWLIIPGTIKWKNDDGSFPEQSNAWLPMTSVNSSAIIMYRGCFPLKMGDEKILNEACFLIEPLSDPPPMLPVSPWGVGSFYDSHHERRELELKRHLFNIGDLSIGIEINQDQKGAEEKNNCLSQALSAKNKGLNTLDLQILLSSYQLLNRKALNIRQGGIATMINGLVGITREPAPVSYQLYQYDNNNHEMIKGDEFLRKNYLLPLPLQLTGIPSKGYCASEFGGEEVLYYNYDVGLLRLFKPLPVK